MRYVVRTAIVVASLVTLACSEESTDAATDARHSGALALQGIGGIEASFQVTRNYVGSYCGRLTVRNGNAKPTTSWRVLLDLRGGRITYLQDGNSASAVGGVVISPTASNAVIQPGASVPVALCATGTVLALLRVTEVSATYGSDSGAGGAASGGSSSTGGSNGFAGTPPAGGRGGSSSASGGQIGLGGAGGLSGVTPTLPAISGTCPTFATGTVTVGGLSGISLQVGPKMQGTGSLLFYWHGTGSTASEVNRLVPSSVRQELLAQGGIIVSFQSSVGTGGDCSGTSTFSKDDFRIADTIAACAVRDHGIDPRRIYTTGCSAGGLQAGCMGALRSSYVAAVAPNSGGTIFSQPIQDSKHVPAVMTMHGGAADFVGVSFATTSARYDTQMKQAGSFVVNCDHGGGHCQAPSSLYVAAWEFMKAHPFGVAPDPYSMGLPASFPSYCDVF